MAKLNVNPTRMELTRLKARLATSVRGHKLLKDKQDELMRRFIAMIKENKKLREQVELEMTDSLEDFLIARAMNSAEMLEEALLIPKESIQLDIQKKNLMSVYVPVMDFKRSNEGDETSIFPYGFHGTSSELDDAVRKLYNALPDLLRLAEVEKACQLMADEIEKTRRRVNALEYMTIPQLEETIDYIRMKLEENDRSSIVRIMKVKEIINKNQEKEAY
ncbi:V-type ATP synthase subunit D [Peptostreptococcus faecalis]|uniref:V-type ATP synthase subunit D n=1 Tax=Peptostreptococcus faecalis TaxID=2045015 RepID=UPI000C7BA9C1|nr:V-type ATP synthase subunit D [Peptostreptococcus faecalis]